MFQKKIENLYLSVIQLEMFQSSNSCLYKTPTETYFANDQYFFKIIHIVVDIASRDNSLLQRYFCISRCSGEVLYIKVAVSL